MIEKKIKFGSTVSVWAARGRRNLGPKSSPPCLREENPESGGLVQFGFFCVPSSDPISLFFLHPED
jgi:hypothetical protein